MSNDQSSKILNYDLDYLRPLRNSGTLSMTFPEIKHMETKINLKHEKIERIVTILETLNTIEIERNDDISIETVIPEINTKTSKE